MRSISTFLQKKGWYCFVLLLFLGTRASSQLLDPRTQPKFINPLPIPSIIDGRNGGLFTIGISQFNQWLGLTNPETQQPMLTTVWGYNGTYPGPTILAKKEVPIEVFWRNNLVDGSNHPLPHLLPIDTTIHWALDENHQWQNYGIPVVTHIHGGHSESASDGLPEAWFTPNFTLKGSQFKKGDIEPYHYSNTQQAATLWYHDHALGVTRLNVYAGLAGYYILTDINEINLKNSQNLPAPPYDIGLAIQDKMFTNTGQLYYPASPEMEEQPNPSILPEFFGDFILVNGMTWPVLDVEPRQYRFRVLNGSDSRFYNLNLPRGMPFLQIGTDNGLLPTPVSLNQLLLGPGERKDIVIDFSNPSLWGQTLIISNNAKTPFPKGSAVDPQTTGRIMAFRVNKTLDPLYPLTTLPNTLRPPIVPLQTSLPARKLILFEAEDEFGRLKPSLGTVENGINEWHDPVTENPMLNSTEVWEIYNETEDAHPIHLHLVSMQLVNRQKFHARIDESDGKPHDIKLIGPPQPPGPDEIGWKDTWIMFPGEVTRVIAKFDIEGLYAWHCHILSHEDHEMMRPLYVGELNIQLEMKDKFEASKVLDREIELKIFPNPFNSKLTVQFTLPESKMIKANIYDAKGTFIKNIQHAGMIKGDQRLIIDGSNLTSGIYFLEIMIDGQRIMRKLVLQK